MRGYQISENRFVGIIKCELVMPLGERLTRGSWLVPSYLALYMSQATTPLVLINRSHITTDFSSNINPTFNNILNIDHIFYIHVRLQNKELIVK